MPRFGTLEIAIIALILILLFGGKKIPELMRGIGQGMKEFKKATKDEEPALVSFVYTATSIPVLTSTLSSLWEK